jgi:thymidine kinase
MSSVEMSEIYTLYPDSFMKGSVMTKYDIMMDDARNPENAFAEEVEKFLELASRLKNRLVVKGLESDLKGTPLKLSPMLVRFANY